MSKIDLGLTITGFNNATGPLRGASEDVKHLGENAQATANRLKAIQVVIAGILIDKTLEFAKAAVTAIASTQGLDLRMQAFAGSAAAADKVMTTLSTNLGASGFKLDTLSASWTRLRSAMTSNDQATTVLTAITNDVAAMGGQDQNINNLSESFQRLFARGFASSREYISVLQQTGLTLGDLAKAAGQTSTQFEGNLKNGFVNAQQFVDDFVKASSARFGFFANNLKGSVAGAISLVTNSISAGISHIGATTDLNARLSAFFQNLAAAITKVMDSISQKDIDAFFDWLAKIQPLIINTIRGIINVGTAVLQLATVLGNFLGHIPPDALEYGMIGYALFGKKGAVILAILGGVKDKIANAVSELNTHDMFGNKIDAPKGLGNIGKNGIGRVDLFGGLMSGGKPGKSPFLDLMPTPEQIAANKKMLDDLMKTFKSGGGAQGNGISYALSQAIEAAQSFAQQLNATLEITKDKIAQLAFKNNGDQLGAELSKYTLEGDAFNKQLADAEVKYKALKVHTKDATDAIQAMRDKQKDYNAQIDLAKQKATELFGIDTKILQVNSALAAMQNQFASKMLSITSNQGGLFNALIGTDAGQTALAVMQQAQGYQEQIAQYSAQILDIQKQLRDVQADPARVAALEQQIDSLKGLQGATQRALGSLSVAGSMQQQLWQQLGNTIESDVGGALSGLLQGTMSLADAGRKMFSDLIDMASKYIVKLLFMKALSAFAFADGGVIPGGVMPFANGGVPGGSNVTAFANGGLTQGPTLFGLAGEAGTEAIMPLTRIGGKLGVQTTGSSGGDHYHLHINAVDTQTGLEFVAKHIDNIDGQLQHKKRLNRGAK